jgi:thiopeptide-type bacteriocin biosynthesis protein
MQHPLSPAANTEKKRRQRSAQVFLYEPLDFVQVRLPLFPVEAYLGLHQQSDAHPWKLDIGNPLVDLAIALASPDLFDELERDNRHPSDAARRASRVLRYLIRMATRPTPYGLFAGVALAHWGEQTTLSLAGMPSVRSRPDMGWLMSLVWQLEALPVVRRELCFRANTAAYVRRGRIFLLEELPSGKPKQGIEVSVKATGVALRALALARQPIPYPALVEALLASTPGATLQKVEALISTLWQHTLLLTDLRPPLTVDQPVAYLQRRLAALPLMAPLLAELQQHLHAIEQWSDSPLEGGVAYRTLLDQARKIESLVDELCLETQGRSGEQSSSITEGRQTPPLQADMAWPLAGTQIAKAVGEEVAALADVVLRLSPFPNGDPLLRAYRQAFIERYGEQREVSLLELLDPHFGLGPPAHYTGNRTAYIEDRESASERVRQQTLLELAMSALCDHRLDVQFDEQMLRHLERRSQLPANVAPSLDLSVFVIASSPQAIDEGDFTLVLGPNVGSEQAGRSVGRFAHLFEASAVAALKQIALREEEVAPAGIRAELVYLPKRNRMANVVIRPLIQRHEIVYGVTPGSGDGEVIPLDEIVIGIRDERFYARWTADGRDLIICVGHMLNPAQAPTVVRFLSELHADNRPRLSDFDWGTAEHLPFLPRVQVGKAILSLARWKITPVMHLPELSLETPAGFLTSLEQWRERWNVPRYVYLSIFDNRLLLDLECPQQAEELRTELRRLKRNESKRSIILQEALPGPADAWVKGREGHYLVELIVPLTLCQRKLKPETRSKEDSQAYLTIAARPQVSSALRLRPPGSDWLFLKLYCAPAHHDDLLAGQISAFARHALTARYAEDWFFIRYADPDPHIRLRFRGQPDKLLRQLLPDASAWGQQLMSEGPCLKFTLDVYDREIERYGGVAGIEAAEALFGADSRAVVALLQLTRSRTVLLDPTILAVVGVDHLLADLGLTSQQRLNWLRAVAPSRQESGATYRQKNAQLRSLLADPAGLLSILGGKLVEDILATRRLTVNQIAQQLAEGWSQQRLTQPLAALYRSYVHMHCNRWGLEREREHEVLQLLLRTLHGLERSPWKS